MRSLRYTAIALLGSAMYRQNAMRTYLSWSLLLVLLGCGDDTTEPCPSEVNQELSVGDWNGEELLALPTELGLGYGSQGGQHVFIDLVVSSACAKRLDIEFKLEDGAGHVVGSGGARANLKGCYALLENQRVPVDYGQEGPAVLTVSASAAGCGFEPVSAPVVIANSYGQ